MTPHLSDEQMYALLSVRPEDAPAQGDAAAAHLPACPRCQAELASMRTALADFRVATAGFAAAHPPSLAARPAAPPRISFFGRAGWAVTLATAGVLTIVSVSLVRPWHGAPPVGPVSPATGRNATATQTESDEALLDGIQRDLSTSIPPSLQPLALPAAAASTTSRQN